ncbi:MAG: OmpH family outer membrane protein [Tannerellaceae bacterium]|nr:OmpH family outer membrane protein [Tannerellaceae bacterium]
MKNINYVINGVLGVAVIILFILHFTNKKDTQATRTTFAATGEEVVGGQLPIAYVNMDSLLMNYNYYKDLNEVLMRKEENYRANIGQRANSLRNEMNDFQRKLDNNAFLTRERAEQEHERLMKKQEELQNLEAQYTQELMIEQQKLIEQLRDSLVSQLNIYNLDKGYQVIFSNNMGDNIIIAEKVYDITGEVTEHLNKNYSPSAK